MEHYITFFYKEYNFIMCNIYYVIMKFLLKIYFYTKRALNAKCHSLFILIIEKKYYYTVFLYFKYSGSDLDQVTRMLKPLLKLYI